MNVLELTQQLQSVFNQHSQNVVDNRTRRGIRTVLIKTKSQLKISYSQQHFSTIRPFTRNSHNDRWNDNCAMRIQFQFQKIFLEQCALRLELSLNASSAGKSIQTSNVQTEQLRPEEDRKSFFFRPVHHAFPFFIRCSIKWSELSTAWLHTICLIIGRQDLKDPCHSVIIERL